RLGHRAAGPRPARPRARAGDLGRARAARRDGLRPALQPAPRPRLGRVPHAGARPLAVRRGHAPRRRRDRRQRPQLRARGAARREGPRRPPAEGSVSPLYPPEWDEIEAPVIAVAPPGPRSKEILARIERTAYAG